MNKDNFAEIATAVILILISLVLTGITFVATCRFITWIIGG